MSETPAAGRGWADYLLVGLFAAVVYANALSSGFVFDDRSLVEENPVVRGQVGPGAILLSPYHAGGGLENTGLYRPVTLLSLSLDHRWSGLDAQGYHLVNLLLHALVSLLVLRLGTQLGLGRAAAWLGAMLFAVHPIHTEAVAAIAGRAELLAAVFGLAALLWYLRDTAPDAVRMSRTWWAAGLFFLALASKESAVTLLGVAVVADVLILRQPGEPLTALARRRWLTPSRGLPAWFVALGAYLGLRYLALGQGLSGPTEIPFVDNPLAHVGSVERLATAAVIGLRYLGLLLWPLRLSADYSHAQIAVVDSMMDLQALAAIATFGLLALGLTVLGRRSSSIALLAWMAPLTLALTSNVLFPIGTVMAERLLYLPSVAVCLLGGSGLVWLGRRTDPRLALALGSVVLALGAWRTVERNADWRNSFTLFESAARVSPRSVKVQTNLGVALFGLGRHDEAQAAFERALAITPDYPATRINLAALLAADGDMQGAERELRHLLEFAPDHGLARLELSEALLQQGRRDEAQAELRQGLAIAPTSAALHARMGSLLAASGRMEEAEAELREALRLAPNAATALSDLALLLERAGATGEALELLDRALAASPRSVALRNNLGNIQRVAGRLDQAIETLEFAIALDPQFSASYYNLGLTLEQADRIAEALTNYRRAIDLDGHGAAWRGVGRIELRVGKAQAALAPLSAALAADANDEEATALRGKALMALQRYPEAEADYRRVLQLNPSSVAARNNLGVIRAYLGDADGARRWWEEALRLAPGSGEIEQNLEQLRQRGR